MPPASLSELLHACECVILCTFVCVCVCAHAYVPHSGYHTQLSLEHLFQSKIGDCIRWTNLMPTLVHPKGSRNPAVRLSRVSLEEIPF